jgi:hypothetical protein
MPVTSLDTTELMVKIGLLFSMLLASIKRPLVFVLLPERNVNRRTMYH